MRRAQVTQLLFQFVLLALVVLLLLTQPGGEGAYFLADTQIIGCLIGQERLSASATQTGIAERRAVTEKDTGTDGGKNQQNQEDHSNFGETHHLPPTA